ncbi:MULTISPECIES: hypothetical protein [Streptomyces]|uniref:MYXO-CTERM domain-containing protein n=1 Tax=Streptomyces melanosporofaciens TaxID=67327 RepID=A0A1H4R2K0_STRMJ|nr:hypothetical protein [Streptomyces melanosporofaciens]SEC26139.1 hypothetical protein SAMN04490356_3484 [Streptomyces melanosporofaciens]
MNPATLRTLPAAALLAGTALTATQAAQAAHAASATSAASTTPAARADDDDGGGLAGTRAGEGRTHPGRTRPPASSPPDEDPSAGTRDGDGDGDGNESGTESDEGAGRFSLVPEWTPSSLPMPQRPDRHQAREPLPSGQPYGAQRTATEPSERAMRVLPLGTGLALTGLGLGLAFFGLRLRRR